MWLCQRGQCPQKMTCSAGYFAEYVSRPTGGKKRDKELRFLELLTWPGIIMLRLKFSQGAINILSCQNFGSNTILPICGLKYYPPLGVGGAGNYQMMVQ